jgi:hypothetical protein
MLAEREGFEPSIELPLYSIIGRTIEHALVWCQNAEGEGHGKKTAESWKASC